MKRILLIKFMSAAVAAANAVPVLYLPAPVITSEVEGDGKVDIEWTYDSDIEPCTNFQIIIYKMHKATAEETFMLAKTDFEYIESDGTMKKHAELGATWDILQECPGWYVKYPVYMDGAMGIDTFFYFAGSDNDDIFGGAYMISPDFDLTKVKNPTLYVKANLGNEAVSVTGGFGLWTWNTDWYDENNIDYKPVPGQDYLFDDLSNTKFVTHEGQLVPDEYLNRTRVMFYGRGYSAFWIDDFELSVNLQEGDMVDCATDLVLLDKDARSYTIDTTGDTDSDYIYAYEVRAIVIEHRDLTDNDYIRFISPLKEKKVIGVTAIEPAVADAEDIAVRVDNGQLRIDGGEGMDVQLFNMAGQLIWRGDAANAPMLPARGVYVVKAGDKSVKAAY